MMPRLWLLAGYVLVSLGCSGRNHAPSLPAQAEVLEGYTYRDVCGRMSGSALHPVEGIWQFTSDGACLAVERVTDSGSRSVADAVVYRMVLVESPDRSVRPGSVIGLLQPTAKAGVYNARIYTSVSNGQLCVPRGFMLHAESDGTGGMAQSLVLVQDKPRYRVDVWNLIPYLYRRVVRRNAPREEVDGCVRVFPEPLPPRFPIYL